MKKLILFFLVVGVSISPLSAQGNLLEFHSVFEKEILESYLNSNQKDLMSLQLIADEKVDQIDAEVFNYEFNKLVDYFIRKQKKSRLSEYFLSDVFYKTHRKLLKRYQKFTTFGDLFKTGNYDCLSATTLYAMLYNELGIDLEVVETNHHIYLKLNTEEGIILVESTDPINGFITDKKEIEQRLNEVVFTDQNQGMYSTKKDDYYKFSFFLNERINLEKLVGLQYYNRAVHKFNLGDATSAIKLLEKGTVFYNNDRFKEFGILIANKLYTDQNLNSQTKSDYLKRIMNFTKVQFVIASL